MLVCPECAHEWSAAAPAGETARVYKDAITLVDPRTGREYPTLLPG